MAVSRRSGWREPNPPCGEAMGRGTVAAGDGGGATTSRHCTSVSPAGCHLPMASPQGRINGKAETMIIIYGTPPTRALRAMWLLNEFHLAPPAITADTAPGGLNWKCVGCGERGLHAG